jgi:hypothetical protein
MFLYLSGGNDASTYGFYERQGPSSYYYFPYINDFGQRGAPSRELKGPQTLVNPPNTRPWRIISGGQEIYNLDNYYVLSVPYVGLSGYSSPGNSFTFENRPWTFVPPGSAQGTPTCLRALPENYDFLPYQIRIEGIPDNTIMSGCGPEIDLSITFNSIFTLQSNKTYTNNENFPYDASIMLPGSLDVGGSITLRNWLIKGSTGCHMYKNLWALSSFPMNENIIWNEEQRLAWPWVGLRGSQTPPITAIKIVTMFSPTPSPTVTPTVTPTKTCTPTPFALYGTDEAKNYQTPTPTPTPSPAPALVYSSSYIPFEITNTGISYNVSQIGTGNPSLTCFRGTNYDFIVLTPSHPFALRISNGDTSTAVDGAYNNNVAAGITSGRVMFTPNSATPDTIYYQCTIHSSMIGIISIKDYNL